MTYSRFEGIEASQMYREHILDHYRNPRNKGVIEEAEQYEDSNPTCGDQIKIYIKFEGEKVKDIKFEGEGCAISQAAASMLTEKAKEKGKKFIKKLDKEKMHDILGIEVIPARIKCMTLAMKVLKTAVYIHEGKDTR